MDIAVIVKDMQVQENQKPVSRRIPQFHPLRADRFALPRWWGHATPMECFFKPTLQEAGHKAQGDGIGHGQLKQAMENALRELGRKMKNGPELPEPLVLS